jgi:two-component system, NarL family, invasion response regulator UvrY
MPILIVSDYPALRRTLREAIDSSFLASVVWEATTGADAMLMIQVEPVDVVILDIAFPYHRGLTRLRLIKRLRPSVKCLVVSMYGEPRYVRRALADGAFGYLVKPAFSGELCHAIQAALSGRQAVGESLHDTRDRRLGCCGTTWTHKFLSARGQKILSLLASGRPLSRIAKQLRLSVKTVSVYQTRILAKLGLKTTADLTRYAASHRLV